MVLLLLIIIIIIVVVVVVVVVNTTITILCRAPTDYDLSGRGEGGTPSVFSHALVGSSV